jgi:hypothetical protein
MSPCESCFPNMPESSSDFLEHAIRYEWDYGLPLPGSRSIAVAFCGCYNHFSYHNVVNIRD